MCSVVILRRPNHDWPVIIGANRDEMVDRPWLPPGRHWPDRDEVIAGLDQLAGGSWLGLNEHGVVATVLNRSRTLGPATGKRSRGELVLEALDHANAADAAEALAQIAPEAYRPFNLLIADNVDAFVLHSRIDQMSGPEVIEVPEGVSLLTDADLNDAEASPRVSRYLPRFRLAKAPDPDQGDWADWLALLGDRGHDEGAGPRGSMNIETEIGFGTSSTALIALPSVAHFDLLPVFDFIAGRPDEAAPEPVALEDATPDAAENRRVS